LLPNNTASESFLHRSETVPIVEWGVGLAVTGRIRDIGQIVLQSSFQTGLSSNHSYCHIFFLMAFLAYYKCNYTMLIYKIIICIYNNNKAAINNNYGRLQDLILSSIFHGYVKGFIRNL
jgi:hypothetical protein